VVGLGNVAVTEIIPGTDLAPLTHYQLFDDAKHKVAEVSR